MGAGLVLALLLTALPQGRAVYRMELAGQPLGVVTLEIACPGAACAVRWLSAQRLPAEAGGAVVERRVELEVDAEGRALGPARITEAGVTRQVTLPPGAVPALLVEAVLEQRLREKVGPAGPPAAGASACLDAADEQTGAPLRACGRHQAGKLRVDLGNELEWVKMGADGLAEDVDLPGQRARFLRDPRAAVPASPPRLFGVEVVGPARPKLGKSFCGVGRDPVPPVVHALLPPPRADGASCREQTADWLGRARAAGFRGRTAVGVAWSGTAWAWHAWAEVRLDEAWVPIDPSFGQAPARSPRFTLATWEGEDEPARAEAGRRILACWGRVHVEP